MVVVLDGLRDVRSFEDVTAERVPAVDVAGIGAVDEEHAAAEVARRSFQEQVKVVRHQAVAVAADVEALDRRGEILEKHPAIEGVEEDRPLARPAASDVMKAVRPHSASSVRLDHRQLGCNFVATELQKDDVSTT
ncbi:MAG TPA: hypothetical protein VFA30_00380 [Gaiellaceae bacterium]|nr:hypothetical protein [Gaiellaceae bacterium]